MDFDDIGQQLEPTLQNRTPADALLEDASVEGDYSTRAIIGEASVPTEYSADAAAVGARALMEANGYADHIEEFLIADGLSTEFPNRSGKQLLDELANFAASEAVDNADNYEEIEYILENISQEEGEQEIIQENEETLSQLINNKADMIRNNRLFLDTLLPEGDYDILYTGGEAEDYNFKEEREKQLHRLKRRVKEEVERVYDEEEAAAETLEQRYDLDNPADLAEAVTELAETFQNFAENYEWNKDAVQNIHNRVATHWKQSENPNPEQFLEEADVDLMHLVDDTEGIYQRDILELFNFEDYDNFEEYEQQYRNTLEEWDSLRGAMENDIDEFDLKLKNLEDKLDRLGIQADQPDVARWFGQISDTSPVEAVTLSLLAQEEIKDDIIDSFPEQYRDQLEVGLTRLYEKRQNEDGETTTTTVESPLGDIDVVHNNMWTNVSSEYSLMRLIDEYKRKQHLGDDMPDTVVTSHPAGGFESVPINSVEGTREISQPGEWLNTEDYDEPIESNDIRFMNLPKFMDMDRLQEGYENGESVDEAKNYYKSWMQTGMVFQHRIETAEGTIEINEHVPEGFLTEIGELVQNNQIDEAVQRMAQDEKQLIDFADEHIGMPEVTPRPSNRQKINAWTEAVNEYFPSDFETGVIYGGDLVHGNVSWGADRNTNNGISTEQVREHIAEQMGDIDYEDLDEEELKNLYKQVIDTFTRNMERTPLVNASKQEKVAQSQIESIEEGLGPDFRVNVTGNHYHTLMGSEETDYMREAQIAGSGDTNPERYELDSMGSLEAGFGLINPFENDLGLFVQHKDKGGKHPMKQTRKLSQAKNTGADVEVYHHDHFPTLNVVHDKVLWGPGATASTNIRGEVNGYGHMSWPQQSLILKDQPGWVSEVTIPHETLENFTDDSLDEEISELLE